MRLKYKILWIENDSDWAESIEDDLKGIVENEFGLVFEKSLYAKQDDNIRFRDYDLILMDLNLETEPSGDKIIKQIRENKIYTDVVFYSADGLKKIKEKARELDLEGVYFSDRDKDLFLQKTKVVIQTTIRKVQDLTNLRGLVMAEVSELDSLMEEIILNYYSDKTPDSNEWKEFQTHIIDKEQERILSKMQNGFFEDKKDGVVIAKHDCIKNCTHIWKDKTINDIVQSIEFESSKKARTIHRIARTILPQTFVFEDYRKEIIDIRNNLAHSKSEIQDGEEVLVTKKLGEMNFTQDKFKEIRQNIKKYHDIFSKLQEKINVQSQQTVV